MGLSIPLAQCWRQNPRMRNFESIITISKNNREKRLWWNILQIVGPRLNYLSTQPEKAGDISRRHQRFPRKMKSEEWAQKFHTDDVSLPRSERCLWLVGSLPHPIRSIIQIWVVTPLQCMEFLCSSLRRHFTGKPVKESRNVACFLRLLSTKKKKRFGLKWIFKTGI